MKYFEIRDSATFIPVVAYRPREELGLMGDGRWSSSLSQTAAKTIDHGLLRSGWGDQTLGVIVTRIDTGRGQIDAYAWSWSRTMTIAHAYIQENWEKLNSGDVIDVEHILGESATKKVSEALQ